MNPIILCFISILILQAFLRIRPVFVKYSFFPTKTSTNKPRVLPPGPTPLPYFGCALQMLRNKPTFRWIHKMMCDMNTSILCIRLGQTHVISIYSPEIAREFLKKQDMVFASRPYCMSAYVTSGYLSTALAPIGTQWKKMRKVLALHVLAPSKHKWLQPKRDEEADHLVKYILNQCHNRSYNNSRSGLVNVRIATQQYCGNVIRKLVFSKRYFGKGTDDGGPGPEEIEHTSAVFTILNYLYSFCISDYFPWLRWITDLDGHEKIIRKAVESVKKYQDPLIDDRIRQWMDGTRKHEEDILDVLIKLDDPVLSSEEIKAQLVELMIATVDNPSNAIEWALAEMINNPIILEKATEELDRVVGQERLVQESDLPKLNYVKACAKEALRMHPVAAFNVPHVSSEDTVVAGYFIPKGSHVLLSRPGLGRNPEVWEDPMRFDPERHLRPDGGEVVLTDHELRMLSFSTGRRGCAGVLLGSTMTGMLLARLVQGFRWEPAPTDDPEASSRIQLVESHQDLSLAKPLVLQASPRLPISVYPS